MEGDDLALLAALAEKVFNTPSDHDNPDALGFSAFSVGGGSNTNALISHIPRPLDRNDNSDHDSPEHSVNVKSEPGSDSEQSHRSSSRRASTTYSLRNTKVPSYDALLKVDITKTPTQKSGKGSLAAPPAPALDLKARFEIPLFTDLERIPTEEDVGRRVPQIKEIINAGLIDSPMTVIPDVRITPREMLFLWIEQIRERYDNKLVIQTIINSVCRMVRNRMRTYRGPGKIEFGHKSDHFPNLPQHQSNSQLTMGTAASALAHIARLTGGPAAAASASAAVGASNVDDSDEENPLLLSSSWDLSGNYPLVEFSPQGITQIKSNQSTNKKGTNKPNNKNNNNSKNKNKSSNKGVKVPTAAAKWPRFQVHSLDTDLRDHIITTACSQAEHICQLAPESTFVFGLSAPAKSGSKRSAVLKHFGYSEDQIVYLFECFEARRLRDQELLSPEEIGDAGVSLPVDPIVEEIPEFLETAKTSTLATVFPSVGFFQRVQVTRGQYWSPFQLVLLRFEIIKEIFGDDITGQAVLKFSLLQRNRKSLYLSKYDARRALQGQPASQRPSHLSHSASGLAWGTKPPTAAKKKRKRTLKERAKLKTSAKQQPDEDEDNEEEEDDEDDDQEEGDDYQEVEQVPVSVVVSEDYVGDAAKAVASHAADAIAALLVTENTTTATPVAVVAAAAAAESESSGSRRPVRNARLSLKKRSPEPSDISDLDDSSSSDEHQQPQQQEEEDDDGNPEKPANEEPEALPQPPPLKKPKLSEQEESEPEPEPEEEEAPEEEEEQEEEESVSPTKSHPKKNNKKERPTSTPTRIQPRRNQPDTVVLSKSRSIKLTAPQKRLSKPSQRWMESGLLEGRRKRAIKKTSKELPELPGRQPYARNANSRKDSYSRL